MIESIHQKEAQGLSCILQSDLFVNLLPMEKKTVIDRAGIMQLRQGALLFSPKKKANHFYYLLSGLIRVFKRKDGSGVDEIANFAPGDIIGDFDFARDAEYDAFAEALEDSSLVMFPGYGLSMDKFALEEPQLNSRILFNSAAMVTGRIKATRKVIIEKAYWVKELHRKVHEDPSTGLWKQTLLDEDINQLLENPMAMIMLKPDRFKILVDARGHDAGDEAMIKIAAILKGITHKLDRGWPMRFKSNETGLVINKCDAGLAEYLALSLSGSIADLPPVPLGNGAADFSFSASVAWGIWPEDDKSWNSLFEGTYELLRNTWHAGGDRIVRYEGKVS
jgi:GGDEF domain-containing protein